MNLMLLRTDEMAADGRARLDGARARHVREVLGLLPGDTLRIGLLDGPVGTGTVHAMSDACVELACTFAAETPPRPRVDLLLALPRPKVLKRLWAQLAALGVGRVILTNAARVERTYFATHVLDPAFYEPLLIEGLQQAQDTRLPAVEIHRLFKPLVEDQLGPACEGELRLLAHPGAPGRIDASVAAAAPARVLLAVGPEGGWVPFELDLLQAHGFHPVALGPRTLRTDTACLALLALVQEALR